MVIINKTNCNLNFLMPNGKNLSIPANSTSGNILASVTLIKSLISMYSADQIGLKLYGSETSVQDDISENIANWIVNE